MHTCTGTLYDLRSTHVSMLTFILLLICLVNSLLSRNLQMQRLLFHFQAYKTIIEWANICFAFFQKFQAEQFIVINIIEIWWGAFALFDGSAIRKHVDVRDNDLGKAIPGVFDFGLYLGQGGCCLPKHGVKGGGVEDLGAVVVRRSAKLVADLPLDGERRFVVCLDVLHLHHFLCCYFCNLLLANKDGGWNCRCRS